MEPIIAKCTVAHRTTVQLDAAGKASIGLNIPEEDAQEFEVGKNYAVSFEETEEEEDEDEVVGRPDQGLPERPSRPDQGLPESPSRPNQDLPEGPDRPNQDLPQRAGKPKVMHTENVTGGLAANPAEKLEQPNVGNKQVNPPRP